MYTVSSVWTKGTNHRTVKAARAEAARRVAQDDQEVRIDRARRDRMLGLIYERINLTAPADLGTIVADNDEDNPLELPL